MDQRQAASDGRPSEAWSQVLRRVEMEWELWSRRADAAVKSLGENL